MADISQIKLPNNSTYTIKDADGRKEAYLEWGGRNFAAGYGPIDAAMVPALGADRFAFLKLAGVTVEYSRDKGVTWVDYGSPAENTGNLFCPSKAATLVIGKADANNKATANGDKYQLRISINTGSANIYSVLNKFVIYVSTNGSNSCTVSLEKATHGDPTTFTSHFSDVPISGWSGFNVINCAGIRTYGNSNSQYQYLRFIFKANGGNTNYNGLNVASLMAFGGVGWTTPSTMARTGDVYSLDYLQNATFPNEVTATEFNGPLNGIAYNARNVLAYASNEVILGANSPTAGNSTNDIVHINYRDVYGGSTSNNSTQITDYHFDNRKGSSSGVTIHADTFTGSAAKVNGHAVNADVPSGAKFTDTKYTANTSKLVTTTVPNVTNKGTVPSLTITSTACDDITGWTTNTPTSASVSGGILTISIGTAADLDYTARSVGSASGWNAGSTPTLGTAITVATGSLASNGGGGTVATGITAS